MKKFLLLFLMPHLLGMDSEKCLTWRGWVDSMHVARERGSIEDQQRLMNFLAGNKLLQNKSFLLMVAAAEHGWCDVIDKLSLPTELATESIQAVLSAAARSNQAMVVGKLIQTHPELSVAAISDAAYIALAQGHIATVEEFSRYPDKVDVKLYTRLVKIVQNSKNKKRVAFLMSQPID
jgi:hypothetical protein